VGHVGHLDLTGFVPWMTNERRHFRHESHLRGGTSPAEIAEIEAWRAREPQAERWARGYW
jgi:hypothetical protein